MSTAVNIHAAKTQFSRLVDRAAKGETIIIAKSGKPVAKLVAIDPSGDAAQPSRIGFLKGKFLVPDDFDTMCRDEIVAMFEGED